MSKGRTELIPFLRHLQQTGWVVSKGSKHLKLTHPGGGIVFCASTPSDYRAILNIRTQTRRIERQHQAQG